MPPAPTARPTKPRTPAVDAMIVKMEEERLRFTREIHKLNREHSRNLRHLEKLRRVSVAAIGINSPLMDDFWAALA